MCPGIHYFKPAIMTHYRWSEIINTGTHYHWFERAKHIFEIMNTGTNYRWFEIINTGTHYRWFHCFKPAIMCPGIHYFKPAIMCQTSDHVSRYSLIQIYAGYFITGLKGLSIYLK
jgi:hypothetical protein